MFLTPGGLDSGSITWACTGSADIGSYLPSGCGVADSGPEVGDAWVPDEMGDATACWDATDDRWEMGDNGCGEYGWEPTDAWYVQCSDFMTNLADKEIAPVGDGGWLYDVPCR